MYKSVVSPFIILFLLSYQRNASVISYDALRNTAVITTATAQPHPHIPFPEYLWKCNSFARSSAAIHLWHWHVLHAVQFTYPEGPDSNWFLVTPHMLTTTLMTGVFIDEELSFCLVLSEKAFCAKCILVYVITLQCGQGGGLFLHFFPLLQQ